MDRQDAAGFASCPGDRWPARRFGRAIEVRRRELGASLLARVTQRVSLAVLDSRWRDELRRLMDELDEIRSRPEAEHRPAVAFARWAAPPDVDLDHELVACDVLRYVLQVEVEAR